MRNRLVRGLVLLAVALGVALGAAGTAGALDSDGSGGGRVVVDGSVWD